MVLKKAPRFSSLPVASTRAAASVGGGGTSSVPSVVLTDLACCRSPANCFDANELSQLLLPASRKSGQIAAIHFLPKYTQGNGA